MVTMRMKAKSQEMGLVHCQKKNGAYTREKTKPKATKPLCSRKRQV